MASTYVRPHRATAVNEQGWTFQFSFDAVNWCGIQEIAQKKLDEIVAADKLHQANGPWTATSIDVGS